MQCLFRPTFLTASVIAVLAFSVGGNTYAEDQASKSDILGKWNLDTEALIKLMEKQFGGDAIPDAQSELIKGMMKNFKMTIEFKADGTMVANMSMGPGQQEQKEGTWSVVSAKGKVLTLATKADDKSEQVKITIFDKDSIGVHPPKDQSGPVEYIPLKRAKEKEQG